MLIWSNSKLYGAIWKYKNYNVCQWNNNKVKKNQRTIGKYRDRISHESGVMIHARYATEDYTTNQAH